MATDSSPADRTWWQRLRGLNSRLNHPLLPALVAMAVAWSLVNGELNENEDDWSSFIVAGDMFIDPDEVPHPILIEAGAGYDGQFFYRLALDPWTPEHHEMGGTLDTPAWRHQRILYPLSVWFVSLGTPRYVPISLVLVNLLALGCVGFAGGVIAGRLDLHALWGVVPAFYPGFFLTLVRDTSEIVAAACMMGGIAAMKLAESRHQWAAPVATFMLTLAVLARETTVLVAGALMVSWLWSRIRRSETSIAWHHWLVPPIVMGLWHLTLYYRWGVIPSVEGGRNLGVPLVGITQFAQEVADRQDRWESVWFVELWFVAAIAVIALIALKWSRSPVFVKIAYVTYAGLATLLTRLIWVEDWSFMRALSELHILAAVVILGAPRWLRIAGVVVWLAFARWMFVEIDHIR